MAGWTNPLNLIRNEIRQIRDEGVIIPETLLQEIESLDPDKDQWEYEKVSKLWDSLDALERDQALAAKEPNSLEEIRALRPDGPRHLQWKPDEKTALNQFHGAWSGRAMGCALGKPVEGMGFHCKENRVIGRTLIKKYLESRGEWPLDNYFLAPEEGCEFDLWCPNSYRENIQYMEPDDDIHYTLIGLGVIESHGKDFTWEDVAQYWSSHLPYNAICTAETQGILNYWNKSGRIPCESGASSQWTSTYRNPYREWIGAQIRADGFAWCAAGKPELAAEFAWKDAHWTHRRNGIYGEMFFAAVQAASFVESDWKELVQVGLSEIPKDCRLAQSIGMLMDWIEEESDWEKLMERVEDHYIGMSPVHTINNALVCIMALAYGNGNPHHSICLSVSGGFDTDCNGATVGSIMCANQGYTKIDSPLLAPLNDTIKPNILGFQDVRMKDLAQRTYEQWKKLDLALFP